MEPPPDSTRAYVITDTDKRGAIIITATILMSWMVLTFATRAYTRTNMNGPFGLDDLLAGIGSAFGVLHTAVLVRATIQGLGKSKELLGTAEIYTAEKLFYISDIMFLIAHCFAKLTVLFLLRRLGREPLYRNMCSAAAALIVVWGAASTIAISVRCNLSKPWVLDDHCTDLKRKWQAFTAFDISTEALLVALTVFLVWGLQMPWSRKAVVVGAFCSRLPVVVTSAIRIHYINLIKDFQDPTLTFTTAILCTEVLVHYSLMAATIPCLKPFVISFNTGWGRGSQTTGKAYNSYHSSEGSATTRNQNMPARPSNRMGYTSDIRQDISHNNTIKAGESSGRDRDRDISEIGSQNPEHMFIRQTTAWTIEHEAYEMKETGITKNA
ncbi:hypothetical protein FQN57_004702 [Myotisia sp. PD_48]|nr:hypothetical protein FQN57_004702 [Myotisia sp. PD_48]